MFTLAHAYKNVDAWISAHSAKSIWFQSALRFISSLRVVSQRRSMEVGCDLLTQQHTNRRTLYGTVCSTIQQATLVFIINEKALVFLFCVCQIPLDGWREETQRVFFEEKKGKYHKNNSVRLNVEDQIGSEVNQLTSLGQDLRPVRPAEDSVMKEDALRSNTNTCFPPLISGERWLFVSLVHFAHLMNH